MAPTTLEAATEYDLDNIKLNDQIIRIEDELYEKQKNEILFLKEEILYLKSHFLSKIILEAN